MLLWWERLANENADASVKTTRPFSQLNAALKKQLFQMSWNFSPSTTAKENVLIGVFDRSRYLHSQGHNIRKPGHFAWGCWNGTKLDFQVSVLGERECQFSSVKG